jgi:hypothetical protein
MKSQIKTLVKKTVIKMLPDELLFRLKVRYYGKAVSNFHEKDLEVIKFIVKRWMVYDGAF